MNRNTYLSCILLVATIVAGCSATGPIFQDAKTPMAGCGLVYVYRPDSFVFSARDAYFYINDVNVADVSNKGYTAFYLAAGDYQFKQKWPIDVPAKAIEVPFTVAAGETHYFRFTTTSGQGQLIWALSHPDIKTGRSEISSQHFQEPKREALAKLGSSACI